MRNNSNFVKYTLIASHVQLNCPDMEDLYEI